MKKLLFIFAVTVIGVVLFFLVQGKHSLICKEVGAQLSPAEITNGFDLAAMDIVNTKYLMAKRRESPSYLEGLIFYSSIGEFKQSHVDSEIDYLVVKETEKSRRSHILTVYPGAAYIVPSRSVKVMDGSAGNKSQFVDYDIAIDACGKLVMAHDGL